jgi:hypothetical protein
MSLAAGAGAPPPPPPPPTGKALHDIPAELLLSIIQYLDTCEYVSFALAVYPLLHRHGLVPPLTIDIYHRITRQRPPPRETAYAESLPPPREHRGWPFPLELTELIISYLEPADIIALLFSQRHLSLCYLPKLTEETRTRLLDSTERRGSHGQKKEG